MNLTNTYYILNCYECPNEQCITKKRRNGKFYYIHRKLKNIKEYWGMEYKNPTPVEDFGIVLTRENGFLCGKLENPSKAVYEDGRPRKWQGSTEFKIKL